jgi:hypothetical protein
MSGGGGSQNTTTTSNAPPQEYLDAYKKITSQASGVAAAPYSPYPGQKLADFSPDQQAGIQGVRNAQGVSDPYINAGAQYIDRATQPIWDNSTHPDAGTMQQLPGKGLSNLDYASNNNIVNTANSGVGGIWGQTASGIGGIQAAGQTFNPNSINQFQDPYTQSVVDAMGRDFQNQNNIQQQGIIGDAIGKGAWGGDRSAVAQGIIAGQQARAQDPIMAQLRSTGYQQATQAAEEQGRQRIGSATSAGQLGLQGASSAGDLGLRGATGQSQAYSDAGKAQLGFYGTQQGAELGSKQAEGWLNMQGAGGMGSLGNQALNSSLTGANALLGVGGMEQGQAQAGLNIPYQEWQASQAYPFQTTGWLSNIVQGLGGASGGTGSTTSPGPSLASQYGGLATAGIGALGSTGAFGGESSDGGWLSNLWNGSVAPTQVPAARGGRIPNRAVGGGIIPSYAFGGPTSGIGPLSGTEPLDEMSVVPGANGINVASASSGRGNILGNYGQTQTTSGGGSKDSEIGSLVKTAGLAAATIWGGPAGAAAGQAFNSAVHFDRGGGIVDDPMYRNVPHLAAGGMGMMGWDPAQMADLRARTGGDPAIEAQSRASKAAFEASNPDVSGMPIPPATGPSIRASDFDSSKLPGLGSPNDAVGISAGSSSPRVSVMQSSHGGPGIPQLTGGGGNGAGIAPSGSVNDYLASQAKGQVGLPKPPAPVAAATDGPAKTMSTNQWGIPDYAIPGPGGIGVATPKQAAYLMDPAYVQEFPGSHGDQGAIYNREGILVRQSDIPGQIMPLHLPGFDSMGGGGGGGEAHGGRIGREEGGDIPQEAPQAPAEPEQNVDIKIPDVGDPTPSVNSTLGLPEGYMGGPTIPHGEGIVASPQGGSASPVHQGPHGPVPMQAGPGYVPPPPELAPVVQQAAAKYGVDPKQLAWLISTESRWNPKAYNRLSGTMGLGQFKPGTAQEMQIDPWDPQQAIMGSAGYLRKMLDKWGNYEKAIERYGTFSTGQGKEADEAVRQRYRAFMAGTQSVARGGGIVGRAWGGPTAPTTEGPGPVSLGPLDLGDEQNPLLIPGARMKQRLNIQTDDDPQAPASPAEPPMPGVDPSGLLVYGASATKDPFVPELEKPRSTAQTIRDVAANPPSSGGTGSGDTGAGAGIVPPPPAPPGDPNAGSSDADKDKEDNPKISGWQKLMNVGLGIMSGTSPHALVNVGAGALKGIAMSDKEQQTMEAAATRRDVAKTNALYREGLLKNAGVKETRLGRQGDERLAIQRQESERKANRDAAISEFNQWKMANGNATTEQRDRRIDELIRNHNLQNDRDLLKIDQKGELFYAGDETKRDIAGQVSEDRRRGQDTVSADRRRGQDIGSEDRRRGQDTRSADAAASREIRITRNGVLERQGDQRLDMTAQGLAMRQQQILNSQSASDERNRLRAQGLDDARMNRILSDASRVWALNPGKKYPDVVKEIQAQEGRLRGSTPPRPSVPTATTKPATTPTKPRIRYDESGNPINAGS